MAVEARAVRKFFGDVVALDGVDLQVAPGEVHGVIGPNGAGKTTLLSLLLGLAGPDEGELDVLGTPVTQRLGVPAGVAGFVEAPGLYPSLTARGNLRQLARLWGLPDAEQRVAAALDQLGLAEVADDRVRGFSLGMRQRLGLAAAVLTRPRLLVLDEPSNGLDPAGRLQVHRTISELADDGVAVVFSSHRMDDLARLCHRVSLLAGGRVVFSGTTTELAAQQRSLEHRLVTTDQTSARELAARIDGITVAPRGGQGDDEALLVSAGADALDELVAALVASGVRLRELSPVVPPLEAAFLALTASHENR